MNPHPLAAALQDVPDVAADAWTRALDGLLRAVGDPLAQIETLLAQYPDFAMGHVLRSGIAVASKDPDLLALVDEAASAALRAPTRWSARERAHLAAACAWRAGEPVIAAERYAAMLRQWPYDLLALRLAQSCYFFLGQTAALRDVVDLVWRDWHADMPGVEYLLAMAAFAYAENGDPSRAQNLGLRALEIEPAFPIAIHSVAHALFDAGEHERGALWMQRRRANWALDGRMLVHNAWHLALFELESGQTRRALAIFDHELLPAVSSAADAADATALLWRMQLDGMHPGERWRWLSAIWAAHITPGFWGLLDIHAAIAFHAAGDFERARCHVYALERCTHGNTHAADVARNVTLPAMHAIGAFFAGAYAESSAALRALLPLLSQTGGSQVQHELLARMMRYAQARQYGSDTIEI